MKYFDELPTDLQEKALDKIRNLDLPLFHPFRDATRELLLNNRSYVFDDHLNLHILSGKELPQ